MQPPPFLENHIADFATKVHDFTAKVRIFIIAGLYILNHGIYYIILFPMRCM